MKGKNKMIQEQLSHIVSIQEAIEYMQSKLEGAGEVTAPIIWRNKMIAELELLRSKTKLEEDLCKLTKAGYGDSINSFKTSQHQERV